MFGRKWQIVIQVMGMITFAFLAIYSLMALIENGVAVWAQEAEASARLVRRHSNRARRVCRR